jgi:hypothetical protein
VLMPGLERFAFASCGIVKEGYSPVTQWSLAPGSVDASYLAGDVRRKTRVRRGGLARPQIIPITPGLPANLGSHDGRAFRRLQDAMVTFRKRWAVLHLSSQIGNGKIRQGRTTLVRRLTIAQASGLGEIADHRVCG